MTNAPKGARRRTPKQERAQQTVEAVLDAVARLVKRGGVEGLTTNRIAATAGVSIGSLYQYFPDKRAILVAVRDRHVEEMARLVERKLLEQAAQPLDQLMRALLEAMVAAHAAEPALYELLLTQLPQEPQGAHEIEARLRKALRHALSARGDEIGPSIDLDRLLFVLTHMLESLAHNVVLRRPPSLSLPDATEEAVRAVLGYLRATG
jgi:AcrR family transcriptional regulator